MARAMSGMRSRSRSNITRSSSRRQLVAETEVRAEAERDVVVRGPVGQKLLWPLEDLLVAVGRWIEEQQFLTLSHQLAVQLDVTSGNAGHVLYRRYPSEHLFDCNRQSPGILPESLHLVGIPKELRHSTANDVSGRLVAADQDQEGLVDE